MSGEVSSGLIERFEIACSCLAVDIESYSEAVSESFTSSVDAYTHYQHCGSHASPDLFPFIDPHYYSSQFQDKLPETVTLFEHYVAYGAAQGISPTPLFDPKYVRLHGANHFGRGDIFDYLSNPDSARVDPHVLFSRQYYLALHDDVARAGVDPFWHFVRYGWKERRAIHPFFRLPEYVRFAFPVNCDRYEFHRCLANALESRDLALMQPLFSVPHYLRSLDSDEDVAPLQHYLVKGWQQGRSPFPLFDQAFFVNQTTQANSSRNPYIEYLSDFSHTYAPSKFLDPAFYLRSTAGASSFRGSVLEHFVRIGAAEGARPHRQVVLSAWRPSRYSSVDPILSFPDASGRQFWLSTLGDRGRLSAALDEIRVIEPELPSDFFDVYTLHPSSNPIRSYDSSLITIVTKCARCNCLVVSQSALGEETVTSLFSSTARFVSNARPWLTFVSCEAPLIRYWHILNGRRDICNFQFPDDAADRPVFIAQAIAASMPNKLIVKTDPFGVALLRSCGPQLLGSVGEVSLLVDFGELGAADRQWLFEYIATGLPSAVRVDLLKQPFRRDDC